MARKLATYGIGAYADMKGSLPPLAPRIMGPNCMKYLQEVIDAGLRSDMIQRFESAFAREMGVKYCIGTSGCTPALHALAAAFDFKPGDEIIVSPITDYGTVQGLLTQNYIPVFADTEPGSINISAVTIEKCITDRTRAILVVHKTGLICDMDPINALAKKHALIVYEDACQSVFGQYKGRLAGTLASAAGFSFDSEKTMGSDQGGCVITNDGELAERIRFIARSRGGEEVPGYGRVHTALGYAHRMPHCTAAVTLAQLEIARENVAHRDKMARYLYGLLSEISGVTPLKIPEYVTVFSCWMLGFKIDPSAFKCNLNDFAKQLHEAGLAGAGASRYYLMPASLRFLQEKAREQVYPFSMPPASRRYSYGAENCPNARDFLETFIRWCTFSEKYRPKDCETAAGIVREVAQKNRR